MQLWDDVAAKLQVSPETARRYLRQTVTLPDGRRITGMAPGASGGQLEEHRLRDTLARQLRGITEARLPYGRADVMTAQAVFEVEPHRSWRHGARQVLAYSAQCGLPPALALFGIIRRDDLLRLYLKLGDREPPMQLWWWDGHRWDHITSRARCVTMPRDARSGTCPHCHQRWVTPGGAVHHCERACQAMSHRDRDDCPATQRRREKLAEWQRERPRR
jgi:hypothetical protein